MSVDTHGVAMATFCKQGRYHGVVSAIALSEKLEGIKSESTHCAWRNVDEGEVTYRDIGAGNQL